MHKPPIIEPLSSGEKLNAYTIREVLGKGGFGITYLAFDTKLKSLVAIKEYFPAEFALRAPDRSVRAKSMQDQEMFDWGKSRFLLEAQLLAQIKHANIVRVLALFEEHNTAYMVMDFEKGQSLADRLDSNALTDQAFLDVILPPLLEGLDFLHSKGFIHRDIKPENIYIRDDGTPVLLDFGSARNAMGKRTKALTTLLTPGYSPLEQYYSTSDDQGPWTDIYACGGVLYRVISGKNPPESALRSSSALSGRPDPLLPAVLAGKGRYRAEFLGAIDKALMVLEKERPQSVAQWYALLYPGGELALARSVWRSEVQRDEYGAETEAPTPPTPPSITDIGDAGEATRLNLLWRNQAQPVDREDPVGFRRILLLSNNIDNLERDRAALNAISPSSVIALSSGQEALNYLCNQAVDLVICDSLLNDMSGLQFLRKQHFWSKLLPVFMVSDDRRRNAVLDAIGLGVSGYATRPCSGSSFVQHLGQVWRIARFYGIEEHRLASARNQLVKEAWDEAVESFELIASIVEDSHEYLDSGFKRLLEDQYGQAIAAFRKAARIQILFVGAYKGLADALLAKGDSPTSKPWSLKASEAIAQFNRMERTRRSFLEILKQQRQTPNPFNTLGVKLRRAGDHAGAIHAYRQAIQLHPNDAHAHYNLARVFASELDHPAALEQLTEALKVDPDFSPAAQLYTMITGVAWRAKGQNRGAGMPSSSANNSLVDD
jgi:serine/threonine protein kinase